MPSSLLTKLTSMIDRIFVQGESAKPASVRQTPACNDYNDGDYNNADTKKLAIEPEENAKELEMLDRLDAGCWWNCKGQKSDDTGNYRFPDCLSTEQITKELDRKIDNGEFPVIDIPDNAIKVIRTLNNPNFSYAEVASVINHSPAMAGEFIKVVNSPVYNRGIPITNLSMALPRLGKSNIRALLYLYSSKIGLEKDPVFYSLAHSVVEHSYAVGVIASFLSQRYFPDPDIAFMAGLLHDIGKLGIIKALAGTVKHNRESFRGIEINDDSFADIFPGLHERAGAFISSHWKLDPMVITAIEHHHDYHDVGFEESEQVARQLTCLINLSDTIARILGCGRPIRKPINIFMEPAIIDLAIDRTPETFSFFNDIPKVISFRLAESENSDESGTAAGHQNKS